MIKKIIGIFLIIIGLLALVTPLTPGFWLFFVGLEFVGVRVLFGDKIKLWWQKFKLFLKTNNKIKMIVLLGKKIVEGLKRFT